MTDRNKLLERIAAQLAVANEMESDFIVLTVSEGKKIANLLKEDERTIKTLAGMYPDANDQPCPPPPKPVCCKMEGG